MDTSQVQINQLNPCPVALLDLLASVICKLERKFLNFIAGIFKGFKVAVPWKTCVSFPPAISHSVQPLLPASRCSLAVS